MTSYSIEAPYQYFTDTDGSPLDAGYIYVGIVNLNPETSAVALYWDEALTIPAAQPIRTISGYPARNGTASRFYSINGAYSISVRNDRGALVFSDQSVSLDNLRKDLANDTDPTKGADLIGYAPGVTVRDELDSLNQFDADLGNSADPTKGAALIGYGGATVATELDNLNSFDLDVRTSNEDTFVIDMHWGALLGTGWTAGDPPFVPGVDPINVVTTNATSAVSAGGTDIPVTTTTGFTAGMLLCYVATDGLYYPFRLFSVLAGPILRADRSLPVGIASGGAIHNFYRDDAHPNDKGGATIVDAALRQLRDPTTGRTRQLEFLARDAAIWSALGATTLTSLTAADYSTLGSAAIGERATQVSGSAVDSGVESQYVGLIGGDYIAKLPVNVGNRTGGFTGSVNVVIRERRQSGQIYSTATSGLLTGYDGNFNVEVPFSCAPGSAISVWVISPQSGPWVFNVGALEFHRLGDRALEVNRGKHVLLGDSWFSPGSPFATAFVARMNNATVAVKGVGGNKADQLIARFSADVTPENPDYVWIMVGTNDYYAGKDWSVFEQEIHQLRRMIQAIGAQPIFFTPSVGAVTYAPQQLHPSRRYALNVRYFPGGSTMPDGSNAVWRSSQINVQSLSVAAGATVTVFTVPGLTRKEAVLRFLSTTTASINVRLEYAASPDGSGGVEPTIFATAAVQRERLLPRVSDVALRFPCMRLHNPTGGAVVVSLVADIAWAQDLV